MKSSLLTDGLFLLWVSLLFVWFPLIAGIGMAFDGGYTWRAYLLAWSVATYPLSFGLAIWLRRRRLGMFLPLLNVIGVLATL